MIPDQGDVKNCLDGPIDIEFGRVFTALCTGWKTTNLLCLSSKLDTDGRSIDNREN